MASSEISRIEVRLCDEEATRFLEALERPDERTVTKLDDLRRRTLSHCSGSGGLEPGSERANRAPTRCSAAH